MELLTMVVVPIINKNNTISVSICVDGIDICQSACNGWALADLC